MGRVRRYRENANENLAIRYCRWRLHDRGFTIISNNCWGADVYPALEVPYQTPFVGLFLRPDCYLRLLGDFRKVIRSPLVFKPDSKYEDINQMRATGEWRLYPIGCLGDQMEIHFLHYQSEAEAKAKWERRAARVASTDDKLFVRFCTRDGPTPGQLAEFDALPFAHKVCFVGRPVATLKSAVCIPTSEEGFRVPPDLHENLLRNPHFDIADWLSGGSGKPRGLYRLLALGG
jgi:uncharacterized protein (DUF1919 family)